MTFVALYEIKQALLLLRKELNANTIEFCVVVSPHHPGQALQQPPQVQENHLIHEGEAE